MRAFIADYLIHFANRGFEYFFHQPQYSIVCGMWPVLIVQLTIVLSLFRHRFSSFHYVWIIAHVLSLLPMILRYFCSNFQLNTFQLLSIWAKRQTDFCIEKYLSCAINGMCLPNEPFARECVFVFVFVCERVFGSVPLLSPSLWLKNSCL